MSSGSRPNLSKLSMDARASLPQIHAVGQKLSFHEDFYHWVLTLTWPAFFFWVTVAYMMTNVCFGALYFVVPHSVASSSGSFLDCFFFSVETFATIGYGDMAPGGSMGHAIMSFEALASILASATITGVTFARLARPTAKVLFSAKAVIAPRNGVPHLMFRMANWRRNQIAEAQLAVMVLMTETTAEGETMRRPLTLKMVRDKNTMFLLSWTAMHAIEEGSPFFGEGAMDKLRAMKADIFLSLTGLDETMGQQIHTRYRYVLEDIVQNARFADILSTKPNGDRIIDYDKFHDIEMIHGGPK